MQTVDAASHRLRRGRRSEPGRHYLITATTHRRRCHFADWMRASVAARALVAPRCWSRSRLCCWVLMPDHMHLVIELGQEPLALAVGRAKALTSRALRKTLDRTLPVWAPGFHDHAVRAEQVLVDVARYVVMNPVRAGLVERIGDYPFWDAMWL